MGHAADELVAPADPSKVSSPFGNVPTFARSMEESIDFFFGNAVMTAQSFHRANLLLIDPSFQRGLAHGENFCYFETVFAAQLSGHRKLGCARTVPKPYSFLLLGLALSEKQTPHIVEKIEKPKDQIEGLESSVVLRRQTLSPTELRARR
jgi:hypothetical protein